MVSHRIIPRAEERGFLFICTAVGSGVFLRFVAGVRLPTSGYQLVWLSFRLGPDTRRCCWMGILANRDGTSVLFCFAQKAVLDEVIIHGLAFIVEGGLAKVDLRFHRGFNAFWFLAEVDGHFLPRSSLMIHDEFPEKGRRGRRQHWVA